MEFTLWYGGALPSRGSREAKHNIRQALESQLRELWAHPPLSDHGHLLMRADEGGMSALIDRHGHTFAAVVSRSLGLRAELDSLMLRPLSPGDLVNKGDIDNRLKTLLDALSAPAQPTQVSDEMRVTTEENPMHVLLEDDSLITRMNVETERLLAPPSADEVRLSIRVTTRVAKPMLGNIGLA